ncbi:unnamed protein product [Orchesella dallaii]|uniref:Uncharacterized protein n=1 Tax=Orchesella dallaii TaxID=48710 RepID=A0ABP1Q7K8_9HEXA
MLSQIPNFKGAPLLIAHRGTLSQSLVDSIAPARAADIYGFFGVTRERNTTLVGIGKLVTEFARICNFTPVVVPQGEVTNGLINESSFTGMISPYTGPSTISACCNPLKTSRASITLTQYKLFNFVYCDVEREIQQTNLQILLQPFNNLIWVILLTAIFLMTICLSRTMKIGLSLSFFVTIGSVFSIANITVSKTKSALLSLWLIGCLLINNMYSGVLTSLLISPAGQDVMKSWDDLITREFHLVSIPQGFFKNIMIMMQGIVETIAAATEVAHKGRGVGGGGDINQKHSSSSFQKNFTLQILYSSIEMKSNLTELINALAFQPKVAMFGTYLLIMMYWIILTEKNQQEFQKSGNRNMRRYCHMGKELNHMYSIPEIWIFKMNPTITNISSHDMARLFYRLEQNGIHIYWMEVHARLQTPRAQDVYRFKSRTEVKEDVPVEPLGFNKGSVYIIFFVTALLDSDCRRQSLFYQL